MDINPIVSIVGVVVVLINSIVGGHNFYNLNKNDKAHAAHSTAINERALKEDVRDIKSDLENDINALEQRFERRITDINSTIQNAKVDILANIDRLVSAFTHK